MYGAGLVGVHGVHTVMASSPLAPCAGTPSAVQRQALSGPPGASAPAEGVAAGGAGQRLQEQLVAQWAQQVVCGPWRQGGPGGPAQVHAAVSAASGRWTAACSEPRTEQWHAWRCRVRHGLRAAAAAARPALRRHQYDISRATRPGASAGRGHGHQARGHRVGGWSQQRRRRRRRWVAAAARLRSRPAVLRSSAPLHRPWAAQAAPAGRAGSPRAPASH